MVAQVLISIFAAALSVVGSVWAGHSPLVCLLIYSLVGSLCLTLLTVLSLLVPFRQARHQGEFS